MSGWLVVGVLVVVIILCFVVWFAGPKKNKVVWRSSLILGLSLFSIMWALTYLAQLHPLIAPIRSDLRPEFAPGHQLK